MEEDDNPYLTPAPSPAVRLVESEGTFGPMLRLAMPSLVEQVLSSLIVLVDLWLPGHYLHGAAALAAISLMIYTMWLLGSLFDTVGIGATAMVARAVGAGDIYQARHVTHQAFVLGVGFALVTTLGGFLLAPW